MAFASASITKPTLTMNLVKKEAYFAPVPSTIFYNDEITALFTLPDPNPSEMEVANAFLIAHPDYIIVTLW